MRILTIIPARGGSKGIPGKNIKMLGDQPLIHWTIRSAMEAGDIEDLYVNTEDAQIKQAVQATGVKVYNRPADLATDEAKSIDVVLDMLATLEKEGKEFDAVLLLQPTYPFRKRRMIADAIEKFRASDADSLISVIPVPDHFNPHWVFEEKEGYLCIATGEESLIPRRQELPASFVRDGAIYLSKTETLKSRLGFIGKKNICIVSDPLNYINLDTADDWEQALKMYERINLD